MRPHNIHQATVAPKKKGYARPLIRHAEYDRKIAASVARRDVPVKVRPLQESTLFTTIAELIQAKRE